MASNNEKWEKIESEYLHKLGRDVRQGRTSPYSRLEKMAIKSTFYYLKKRYKAPEEKRGKNE